MPAVTLNARFDIEGYEADGTVGVQGERLWVLVAERVGDLYVGILDNQPACLEPKDDVYLILGAEIPFRPEHVIDIGEPPAEYVAWQLGQPGPAGRSTTKMEVKVAMPQLAKLLLALLFLAMPGGSSPSLAVNVFGG